MLLIEHELSFEEWQETVFDKTLNEDITDEDLMKLYEMYLAAYNSEE